jgi:hypothetical protein
MCLTDHLVVRGLDHRAHPLFAVRTVRDLPGAETVCAATA